MEEKRKWYFKISVLIIAFLSVGPLALPLLWRNPYINRRVKTAATVIILILSYFLVIATVKTINAVLDYYKLFLESMR